MAGLLTYQEQVSFARDQIRRGKVTQGGTWQHGRAWGKMWSGVVAGYVVALETIADGPYMRAGSFCVRAQPPQEAKP